jgi:hypothetical protein
MGGASRTYGGREVFTGFGGDSWGRERTLRIEQRLEYNIKMDLKEVGCVGMDWLDLAHVGRAASIVNVVMNFRVPENAVNFLAS